MSYSVSTLLLRNLSDVFGENDPARRRAGTSRELAPLFATAQFRPIIEPVKESLGSLQKALATVIEAEGRAVVIVKPMLYFAAFKQHYSLFAASDTSFAALEDEQALPRQSALYRRRCATGVGPRAVRSLNSANNVSNRFNDEFGLIALDKVSALFSEAKLPTLKCRNRSPL